MSGAAALFVSNQVMKANKHLTNNSTFLDGLTFEEKEEEIKKEKEIYNSLSDETKADYKINKKKLLNEEKKYIRNVWIGCAVAVVIILIFFGLAFKYGRVFGIICFFMSVFTVIFALVNLKADSLYVDHEYIFQKTVEEENPM